MNKNHLSRKDEKKRIRGINDLIRNYETKIKDMKNDDQYVDIIIYGHRIAESMINLYIEKIGFNKDYKKFDLSSNYAIEPITQKFILFLEIMAEYRNEVVYGAKPNYNLTKTFLDTFNYFLLGFNEIYSIKSYTDNTFRTYHLSSIISSLPPVEEEIEAEETDKRPAVALSLPPTKDKIEAEETDKRPAVALSLPPTKDKIEAEEVVDANVFCIIDEDKINTSKPKDFITKEKPFDEIKKAKTLKNKSQKLQKRINKLNRETEKLENEIQLDFSKFEEIKINEMHQEREADLLTEPPKYNKPTFRSENLFSKKELESETKRINEEKKEIINEAKYLEKSIYSFNNDMGIYHMPINQYPFSSGYHDMYSPSNNLNRTFYIDPEIVNISQNNQNYIGYLGEFITRQVNEALDEKIGKLFEEVRVNTEITKEVRDISQSTAEKIDIIIKNMDNIMNTLQSFSSRQINNASSQEEIEKILKSFTEEYIETIKGYWEEKSANEEYIREKRKLEISLGKNAWKKMSKKSQDFLVTSKVMYNDFIMIEDKVDYSGVCILVSKALEEEIFRRFFSDFITYLSGKYGNNYSKYHTALTYNGINTLFADQFTMGSIAFVLCYKNDRHDTVNAINNNEKVLMDFCKDKIFPNKTEIEIKRLLNDYGRKIEKIRKDYRNPSAHRNQIKRVNAEECFNLVLDIEKLLKRMLESFDY